MVSRASCSGEGKEQCGGTPPLDLTQAGRDGKISGVHSFCKCSCALTDDLVVNVMTEETTSVVLEHLRHIRARVDGLADDMRQVILRLGAQDRHRSGLHISDVGQNAEIDRIKERLQRIERRLELAD
jgi:hypothetical protein